MKKLPPPPPEANRQTPPLAVSVPPAPPAPTEAPKRKAPAGGTLALLREFQRKRTPGAGRPSAIPHAEFLLEQFEAYVQFAYDNPTKAPLAAHGRDGWADHDRRVHPMLSIVSFCTFMGMYDSNWYDNWQHREDLKDACRYIKKQIEAHNVDGASSGLLKSDIIARYHGLADRQKVESNVSAKVTAVADFGEDDAPRYHPDDTMCQGPLYTSAQIAAGVEWSGPPSNAALQHVK